MGGMKDTLGDVPYAAAYPASPGYTEPTTSRDAAIRMTPSAAGLRERVLDALRQKASTADETATALGLSILAIRPRLSELHKLGRIERTQERRKNDSGMSAAVWRVRPCNAA